MELDAYLAEQSQQGRLNGSVLVIQKGRTVLDRAYGAADRETGRSNTPQTAYQIASVSKQFTAAALLLLQEQGKLSVYDHIQAWVPECPVEWEPITIHHLLTHTSGMGHYWGDFIEVNLYQPTTRENLLRLFFEHPLKFSPGSGWSYSSPAYVLLAHIVEQVSGESYAAFLQRSVFQPLGLADTGAGTRAPRPEQQAVGYENGGPVPSLELETVSIGAGDIWSTTHDLARWDTALVTPGLLLNETSLQAMFTPHAAIPDSFIEIPGTSYGYGWCITQVQGHQTRLHPGDNAGFCSLNIHLPNLESIIILLSNDVESDLSATSRRLLSELMGDQ